MRKYILTLGRVNKQYTLRFVPEATLVVQSQEADQHRLMRPNQPLLVLPDEIKTFGATNRYMLDVIAPAEPDQKIVLMDDDLTFYRRFPDSTKLHNCSPMDMKVMWDAIETQLTAYAHVSVSAREGNNRLDVPYHDNMRYMRVRAYNVGLFPNNVTVDRVNCMCDFDLNLQLLTAGLPNRVLTDFAQHHPGTQNPGGCETQRTLESHRKETQALADFWPGFVKLVQKNNKGGGEFGQRQEVVVSWAKAYKSSLVK